MSATHIRSTTANAPLVGINCAALPEHLVKAGFFGCKRKAFTGTKTALGLRIPQNILC
jgi:transcriptional regulator with PAS, ATPase and Fis domain